MTHCSDYRLALTQNFVYRSSAPSKRVTEITEDSPMETWLSTKAPTVKQQAVLTLHFWCFNSAVVFDELHKQARCVILTSGTLAPLNSFACELGVPFPNHLEAFHVISPSQVLVAGVSHSPSGREMHAIYKNCANFEFQDELGRMMLSFCEIVPNGILCFLASYSFLERLKSRWENTSMKEQFSQTKHVLFEGRDSQNFESTIRDYYRLIEATKVPHSDRRNGVLLFAVCRGKISEGLDFADDRARLVVTVGIPYPHFKDPQVVLKREFNDLNRRNPPESGHLLLSGSEWYDIQAFRALNQALGRCIRHRNDWGALIMIDKRFVPVTERSWHGVSKWVRKNAQAFDRFDALKHSLEEFVKQRLLTMKLEDDMKDAE